jgi:hypothetical protein
VPGVELVEVLLDELDALGIALDGEDAAVGEQVIGFDADRARAGAKVPERMSWRSLSLARSPPDLLLGDQLFD